MSATILTDRRPTPDRLTVLNKILWMSPMKRMQPERPQMSAKRYTMNPNRLLADILSGFEGQFFRARLILNIRQSQSGVLNVNKGCAESVLKLVLGRVISVSRPGSSLDLAWSRTSEGLILQLHLSPPAQQGQGRSSLPLLPEGSPLRRQLKDAGIRYEAGSSNGPWTLIFDAIEI